MGTSVRENLRAKICFGALKNSRWEHQSGKIYALKFVLVRLKTADGNISQGKSTR
jgi:hypothetical protein